MRRHRAAPPPPVETTGVHLLFATDWPETIRDATDYLAAKGHRVEVLTGLEARDRLTRDLPTILITKLVMRGIDGYELIRDMYQAHRPPDFVPTILMAALCADGRPGNVWSEPIDAHLIEPVNPWQLVLTVEQVLYRKVRPVPISPSFRAMLSRPDEAPGG